MWCRSDGRQRECGEPVALLGFMEGGYHLALSHDMGSLDCRSAGDEIGDGKAGRGLDWRLGVQIVGNAERGTVVPDMAVTGCMVRLW